MKRYLTLALCASMAACASQPSSVEAVYISPTTYRSWDCDMLKDEHARLTHEVTRVAQLQKENADTDTAAMSVGLILFLPALLALAATKDRKQELGRLKGEYEAVAQIQKEKLCPIPETPQVQDPSKGPEQKDAEKAVPAKT